MPDLITIGGAVTIAATTPDSVDLRVRGTAPRTSPKRDDRAEIRGSMHHQGG